MAEPEDVYAYDSSMPIFYLTVVGVLSITTILTAVKTGDMQMKEWGIFYTVLALFSLSGIYFVLSSHDELPIRPVSSGIQDILIGFAMGFSFLVIGTLIGSIIASTMMGIRFSMMTWGQFGVVDPVIGTKFPAYITLDVKKMNDALLNLIVGYAESGLFHNVLPYLARDPDNSYFMALLSNIGFGFLHWYAYNNPYLIIVAVAAGTSLTLIGLQLARKGIPAQQGINLAHMTWNVLVLLFT